MACLSDYMIFPLPKSFTKKRRNSHKLVLCLLDSNSIQASIQRVQRKQRNGRVITSLKLSDFPTSPSSDMMHSIQNLLEELLAFASRIEELEIDRNSLQFPRQALLELLQQTQASLRVLSLGKLEGCGSRKNDNNNSQNTIESLQNAIQGHTSLEKVFLGPGSIDAYLPAVAKCPKLNSLELRVSRGDPNPNETTGMICKCLQNTQSLKTLSLRTKFQELQEIGEFLETNSHLEELTLSGFSNYRTCVNPPSLLPIAQALRHNRSLKRLNFVDYRHYDHCLPEDHAQAFIEMMKENMVLESIVLAGEAQDKEELRIPEPYQKEIPFYCRLNKEVQRGDLLQGATSREDWVDTIVDHKDDHQAIFYLLSMDPTVLID